MLNEKLSKQKINALNNKLIEEEGFEKEDVKVVN